MNGAPQYLLHHFRILVSRIVHYEATDLSLTVELYTQVKWGNYVNLHGAHVLVIHEMTLVFKIKAKWTPHSGIRISFQRIHWNVWSHFTWLWLMITVEAMNNYEYHTHTHSESWNVYIINKSIKFCSRFAAGIFLVGGHQCLPSESR